MPDHTDTIALLSIAVIMLVLWASWEVIKPDAVDTKRRKDKNPQG